mmetsp:Transcript_38629/g.129202  ORF Transcript_38629/g.129202 Transcript_38629/m.129202 type:complete len:232 (-) Transcript_38629:112-807(-)
MTLGHRGPTTWRPTALTSATTTTRPPSPSCRQMALAPAPLPVRAPPRASRPPTSTDRSTAAGKVGSVASCRSPAGATAATATAILPTAPLLMRTSSTRTATATARTMTARTAGGCAITGLEAIQARSTAAAGGARQCTASSTAVTTASPSARPRSPPPAERGAWALPMVCSRESSTVGCDLPRRKRRARRRLQPHVRRPPSQARPRHQRRHVLDGAQFCCQVRSKDHMRST